MSVFLVVSERSQDLPLVITDIRSLSTPLQGYVYVWLFMHIFFSLLSINTFQTAHVSLSRQKRPQADPTPSSSKKPKVLAPPEASAPQKAADVNPNVSAFNRNKPTEERERSQICLRMTHGDNEAAASDAAESNPGAATTTTQTDIRVKLENLSQPVTDVMAMSIEPTSSPSSNQMPKEKTLQKSTASAALLQSPPPPHGKELGGHSNFCCSVRPPLSGTQQLRGQVEEVTKERDSLQEQVHLLTRQLQEAQAERQCSCAEDGLDYKSLFEEAQQRVGELLKEREALQAAAEGKLRQVQGQGGGDDDASIDCLLIELDDCRMKRDEVRSEVRHCLCFSSMSKCIFSAPPAIRPYLPTLFPV